MPFYGIVLGMGKEYSAQPWRLRRVALVFLLVLTVAGYTASEHVDYLRDNKAGVQEDVLAARIEKDDSLILAVEAINQLEINGRDVTRNYSRDKFGNDWADVKGCDTRNRILQRDLTGIDVDEDGCKVLSGTLEKGPFTGEKISFQRGVGTSGDIHLEHVVAVSDAWAKGASDLTPEKRVEFYNDPLNLIAVDGPTNMEKGGSDASEWLPREGYRCRYVARQIAVKLEYGLWITSNEYNAMDRVLQTCPLQVLPVET